MEPRQLQGVPELTDAERAELARQATQRVLTEEEARQLGMANLVSLSTYTAAETPETRALNHRIWEVRRQKQLDDQRYAQFVALVVLGIFVLGIVVTLVVTASAAK